MKQQSALRRLLTPVFRQGSHYTPPWRSRCREKGNASMSGLFSGLPITMIPGILFSNSFLTTNRVGDFDEAFVSRIHMSLYYPELKKEQTKQLFKLNLDLIKDRFNAQNRKLTFDDSAIINFAEIHFDNHEHARWNGRQIRNASQTALALAEFDALNKSFSIELNNTFSEYLGDVFGTDGDKRAEENRLCARSEKNAEYLSKLMQRAAEKSQTSFRGHRNENSGSRYSRNEFQLTTQHSSGAYENSGHIYGQNSPIGVQQENYTYAQPTGLQQSNISFPQPMTIHDSRGQPILYPQQARSSSSPNSNQLAYPQPIPVTRPQHQHVISLMCSHKTGYTSRLNIKALNKARYQNAKGI
ncbi:hypothetical protein BPAE_0002g00400 [Botrytis paeoniae]|uniref:AAA+ ATPase lid domain-containing protein n=1 Tax=Botrytis paeoniae TaxID=278948 RepID=A0A4Z1G7D1_9HELO|nr:hypothetical protein BPAE_0002g00400 [Botrytis paeoniae]